MSIPRFFLLANGRKMPSVGLGTFEMTGDKLKEALDFALNVGYRHIDTAASYGNEKEIGEVINDRVRSGKLKRKDVFVTSKVHRTHLRENRVKESVHRSRENLKMSAIDLVLIHAPWSSIVKRDQQAVMQNCFVPLNILESWRAFENLYEDGFVSSIGVSNFTAEQIDSVLEIQKVPISNVQFEAHAYYQQKNLKRLCDKNNIVVSAYAPLGSPARSNRQHRGDESVLKDPVIVDISKRYQKTPAQVLLNFLLKCRMVVLPKSCHRERIEENLACLDWSLSHGDIFKILTLDRGVKFFTFPYMKGHPDFFENEEF